MPDGKRALVAHDLSPAPRVGRPTNRFLLACSRPQVSGSLVVGARAVMSGLTPDCYQLGLKTMRYRLRRGRIVARAPKNAQRRESRQSRSGIEPPSRNLLARRSCMISIGTNAASQITPEATKSDQRRVSHRGPSRSAAARGANDQSPQPLADIPTQGSSARSSSVAEASRPGAGDDHHRDREQLARTEVLAEHHEAGQRGDRRVERHQHAEYRRRESSQRL
jgi:hypothetical protein